MTAQEPHFLRSLQSNGSSQQTRSVASVETPDLRAGLTKPSVVSRNGQIADQVEDVAAANGVPRHHGDDGLWDSTDQDLQVEDVQSTHPVARHFVITDVAIVATNFLVASRTERIRSLSSKNNHPNFNVVTCTSEGILEFEKRLWPKRVSSIRATNRNFGDALGHFKRDVVVVALGQPVRGGK